MKPFNSQGFTLLEIILSLALLAFISILTATSIQSAIQFKSKTIGKIEETSYLSDALKIMAEDIRLAYNYKDINIEVFNLAQEERQKRAETKNSSKTGANIDPDEAPPTTPTPTPTPPIQPPTTSQQNFTKKKENRFTHFLGQRDRLDFTSLSFSRTVENSNFSDQAEIGYYIEDCRGRLDKRQRSQCLWRRVSPLIDDNIEEGGSKQVLLENVNSLKLRYIGPESEEEWRQDWMSDQRGDAVTRGRFPYAVEITLEVKGSKEGAKPLAMTIVAPLSFPNNQKSTEEKANEQTRTPRR